VLERWTRAVLRFRAPVVAGWLVVFAVGAVAAVRLPALLSTSFTVPGTESERASRLLGAGFGEKPEGTFVVVFDVRRPTKRLDRELEARLASAARDVPGGRPGPLRRGAGIEYGDVATPFRLARAKRYTDDLRRALRDDPGPRAWVTGQPALQHDVDPILRSDLRRAELVAVPIALAILVAVLGLSLAVAIPLIFAACSITATLAVVWLIARASPMTTYVPALVELIGLGLAIDYSLLIVHRYREEADAGSSAEDAVVRTMATAGRAIVASGFAVAIGLALLLLVPVPLVRSMGIGGLLVPLVSIAGVLTLQPVLLSLFGGRGRRARGGLGLWTRVGEAVVRRPVLSLVSGLLVLAGLAAPFVALQVGPGSFSRLPEGPEAMQGFAKLTEGVGPGAVAPSQVVVDTGVAGGAHSPAVRAAVTRLADLLFHDPEVLVVANGRKPPYVDDERRRARVVVIGRHEYGDPRSRALVDRVRATYVPRARFPAGAVVATGGAPPQGVDFLDRAYARLPWIVLGVLAATYLVLLRSFRSLVLPLEAVVLNLLTVAAVSGLLVVAFQWGAGRMLGLEETTDIEGWVPIFLFATLFGLSMDYEVFLVSRMREAYDEHPETESAIVRGLARSGRVVTAAAAIMVVAFAGFVSGRLVGLQQLGLGLAAGVLIDATLVRMLVLPSLMALLGRWNWWLPPAVARVLRVAPSPLRS
jgi:RND superfamily putative drug exporter